MHSLWTRYHEHRQRQHRPTASQPAERPHLGLGHRTHTSTRHKMPLCLLTAMQLRNALRIGTWTVLWPDSGEPYEWCTGCTERLNEASTL